MEDSKIVTVVGIKKEKLWGQPPHMLESNRTGETVGLSFSITELTCIFENQNRMEMSVKTKLLSLTATVTGLTRIPTPITQGLCEFRCGMVLDFKNQELEKLVGTWGLGLFQVP